ncbi:hypothetical protein Pelo_8141 [Pelomyxa schiedti]|nr:hypothetical protein Pelo_12197 [Pelomyxa schiedti]KAH3760065.1 hypothetical protein Pelo_8141 [Pelomyxa schiedti]
MADPPGQNCRYLTLVRGRHLEWVLNKLERGWRRRTKLKHHDRPYRPPANMKVLAVFKVRNQRLKERFIKSAQRLKEHAHKRWVFHGTRCICNLLKQNQNPSPPVCNSARCPVCSIIKNGFKVKFSSPKHKVGKAIYTAPSVSVADGYAKKRLGVQVLFILRVILGKKRNFSLRHHRHPHVSGLDAAVLGPHERKREYAIFRDRLALPEYLILYKKQRDRIVLPPVTKKLKVDNVSEKITVEKDKDDKGKKDKKNKKEKDKKHKKNKKKDKKDKKDKKHKHKHKHKDKDKKDKEKDRKDKKHKDKDKHKHKKDKKDKKHKKEKGCTHKWCRALRSKAKINAGAGVALLATTPTKDFLLGLGKERGGTYKGEYNIAAGKAERCDRVKGKLCWFNLAKRELKEEFKLSRFKVGEPEATHRFRFADLLNKEKPYILVRRNVDGRRTPVFIVNLPPGTHYFKLRNSIKKAMGKHNRKQGIPRHQKEMVDFAWFSAKTGKMEKDPRHPPKNHARLSLFAKSVRTFVSKYIKTV